MRLRVNLLVAVKRLLPSIGLVRVPQGTYFSTTSCETLTCRVDKGLGLKKGKSTQKHGLALSLFHPLLKKNDRAFYSFTNLCFYVFYIYIYTKTTTTTGSKGYATSCDFLRTLWYG